ncbi:hypothetical protein [Haloferula sp.]|uniref:hypothetical protein n=1 Tax=Haloferula sp. TaxID=2497595 RepID=UPI003C759C41
MIPPPLPTSSDVSFEVFYGQAKGGIRLDGTKVLVERIQDAHQKAAVWLNRHPGIEILSITNGSHDSSGANAVFITIWYRQPPR